MKKRIICLVAIFLFIPKVVMAEEVYNFTNVVEASGSETEGSFNVNNKNSIDIKCKFNGDKDTYYSYGVYDGFNPKDLSSYNGMWISLKEKSGKDTNITIVLQDADKKIMEYSKQYKYIKKVDNHDIITTANNGNIIITSNEDTKLFLPFEHNKDFDYSSIVSFGINISGAGNTEAEIEASSISFAKEKAYDSLEAFDGINIKGENDIYALTYGKVTTSPYVVEGAKNYKFITDNLPSGVNLMEDGRITVDSNVKPQVIYLTAQVNDSIYINYPITILNSWTVDAKESNYYIPDEDSNLLDVCDYKNILSDTNLNIVRIVLIVIGGAVGAIYIIKRQKTKNKK